MACRLTRTRTIQRTPRRPLNRRLCLSRLEDRTVPATYTVNLTSDGSPPAGLGSGLTGDLRYCIDQANKNAGADVIAFDPLVFSGPTTITLTGGDLGITDSLTITGT